MNTQFNVIQMKKFPVGSTPVKPLRESIESADFSLYDIQQVTKLLSFAQVLCEKGFDGIEQLCNEVQYITQERAYLLLNRQRTRVQVPSVPCLSIPVQFGQSTYGTLCVDFDPHRAEEPALPMAVAQLLTQVCGWLLHTFEQSAFLQGQYKKLEYYVHGSLTRREHEVLMLLCRGYNRREIADILCIALATVGKHLQHIYEQLGVHSEHDAILAAYQIGLFSLVNQRELFEV